MGGTGAVISALFILVLLNKASTSEGVVVPIDTYISESNFGTTEDKKIALSTAGCQAYQICRGYNPLNETCTGSNGDYGMTSCTDPSHRYIIEGCCKPNSTFNKVTYVWCCKSQIDSRQLKLYSPAMATGVPPVSPTKKASSCMVEQNTFFSYSYVIKHEGRGYHYVNSIEECAQWCEEVKRCKYWSMYKEKGRNPYDSDYNKYSCYTFHKLLNHNHNRADVEPRGISGSKGCSAGFGFEIRGGPSSLEGNVFFNGNPICDDYWDDKDANVFCKMMGFVSGTATRKSTYGPVGASYSMDDVNCKKGTETHILFCDYTTQEDCGQDEAAGVICAEADPVDCTWTEWSEWSECSQSCGVGTMTRNRIVKKEAAHGGVECSGDRVERGDCNTSKDCGGENLDDVLAKMKNLDDVLAKMKSQIQSNQNQIEKLTKTMESNTQSIRALLVKLENIYTLMNSWL